MLGGDKHGWEKFIKWQKRTCPSSQAYCLGFNWSYHFFFGIKILNLSLRGSYFQREKWKWGSWIQNVGIIFVFWIDVTFVKLFYRSNLFKISLTFHILTREREPKIDINWKSWPKPFKQKMIIKKTTKVMPLKNRCTFRIKTTKN